MSVQICEGIWRNRLGQRLVITQCEPVAGQRWTDGMYHVGDDGRFSAKESNLDLVEYIGQRPEIDQTAKIELLRTTLTQQTAEIDRLRAEGADAIERLQAKWQTEFTAAQQLRSEAERLQAEIERLKNMDYVLSSTQKHAESLERLLDNSREELQQLQADQAADEQHSKGERAAYLGIIKALWEMRR